MKTNNRFLLAAILAVAMAFTFNGCSSDDDGGGGDGGNPPSGGITNGTGSFSGPGAGEKAQAYADGEKYTGNADIQIRACDEDWDNCEYIDAGKIESGIVKLQLPNIAPTYLRATIDKLFEIEDRGCNIPSNVKVVGVVEFKAKDMAPPISNYTDEGYLSFGYYQEDRDTGESVMEDVWYIYSSGAANISCNYDFEDDREVLKYSFNLNLAQGWNEMYHTDNCTSRHNCNIKWSTDKSILKHLNDMKWNLGY
jgi:hypothetical protein